MQGRRRSYSSSSSYILRSCGPVSVQLSVPFRFSMLTYSFLIVVDFGHVAAIVGYMIYARGLGVLYRIIG